MATLVASPVAAPLAKPTGRLPSLLSEQSETTSLVDDLITAWSGQQSRSHILGQPIHPEEPSSYPFPSFCDDDYLVLDSHWTRLSHDFDNSNFMLDFDGYVHDQDKPAAVTENTHHEAFNSISLTGFFGDSLDPAQSIPHGVWSSQQSLNHSTVISAKAHDQEPSSMPLFPINDDPLPTWNALLEEVYYEALGPVESPKMKPPSSLRCPEALSQKAARTPLQVTPSEEIQFPIIPMMSTSTPPSKTPDQMVSTPFDRHYSKASSNRKRQKINELHHNNKLQYRDTTGTVIGALIILGDDKGLRKPYSAVDKAQTKATRQRGACAPCRISKKRCNRPESPYECCNNCKSKVLSMPCFVAKIIEAQLFRDKPSPKHPRSALRHSIFESLTDISPHPRRQRPIIVNLTQDLGLQMLIAVTRYDPIPGETAHRVWKKDGQTLHIEMPPYCIANMQDAQRHMLEYISNFRSAWLKHVLGCSNEITRNLFDQAQRFAAFSPTSMVSKALDLCAASRIIERDWRICGGPQDLAIPLDSNDEANPFFNFMPITPMMDAQLDQIVIQSFLLPKRHALLTLLEAKMTSSSNSTSFFEIFLTVSVLLSHAEWLLSHSHQSAVRVGAKTRYNYIPRAEAYFHTCNTLIAHWHHMCRGMCLAEVEWSDDGVRKWAGLDNEQVHFLEDLKKRVNLDESKSMMLSLRKQNMYESELYWCHQLFFSNWVAGAKTVEDALLPTE